MSYIVNTMPSVTPKRPATFRIDDDVLDGLQKVKDVHGISVSDQVVRALLSWLDTMGVQLVGKVTMKLLERLEGVGEVRHEDGKVVGSFPYHLSVWQEVHRLKTMGGTTSVDGLKSTDGIIRSRGRELVSLVGESLILKLEDGRELPFFFHKSNGAIAARGPLQ